jgi:N-acetylglucosaminyldiphosphoundecaprenol N-acetyl-beta-D-mannosaminyltransferase
MSMPARVDVLGLPVTATTPAAALDRLSVLVAAHERAFFTFTSVHGVIAARDDPEVEAAHLRADHVASDGMPLVWACRRAGVRGAERVYGPDFMVAACARAAERGWRVFLYGGAVGTPERLAQHLVDRFPGLEVVGAHSPPFRSLTPTEDAAIVEMIDVAAPDLVFVGLSTPKQELWMADHVGRIPGVLLGVGAAFDFHAGLVPQAPQWMQRAGLEWLFRVGVEPRRLAGRYLRNNPRFVAAIARHPPRRLNGGDAANEGP